MSVDFYKKKIQKYLDDGQPQNAVLLTDILCNLDPDSIDTEILRATVLFEMREFDGVLRVTKNIIEENSDCAEAFDLAMRASFELANIKDCVTYADKLISLHYKDVAAFCFLGKCAELSQDTKNAALHYQRALNIDPFCEEAINALIERHLLGVRELADLIDNLELPAEATALRESYKARLNIKLETFVDGLPKSLVFLHNARVEYAKNNLRQALSLTAELLKEDCFNRESVCLHLSILVDMKASPKLFEMAHFLSKNKAHAELAVYAIGCFYYSLSNYERAGRYFSRGTELDCYFCEAWIAYGHCYAKLEEGEQALNVYRRAMSYFPGLHCCGTFIGMQYNRIHQWPIAMSFFSEVLKITPDDPLVLNEIGVLFTRTQKYSEALEFLFNAYRNLPSNENPSEHFDCIIFNLATVLRKVGKYADAIKYYDDYVKCRPNASHGYCALGFTYHLDGNIKSAISNYHIALSIKSDSFCQDLLDRALATDFGQNVGGANWDVQSPSSAGEVVFSTIAKVHEKGSPSEESPRLSVGRSLTF